MSRSQRFILVPIILSFLFVTMPLSSKSAAAVPPANSSPAGTMAATPLKTSAIQSDGPVIQAIMMAVNTTRGLFGVSTVYIADNNGNAVTTASVTLAGNGKSVLLSFKGVEPSMSGVATLYGVPPITGGIYQSTMGVTIGKNYTFNVKIGGSSYASTIMAINGNPAISSGSSGVTCTWAKNAGNMSLIVVGEKGKDNVLWHIGSPIPNNPYMVPKSVFCNETPGEDRYAVFLQIIQLNQSSFPGCKASSFTFFMNERQHLY